MFELFMYVYSCNALSARFFAVDRALNSYFMTYDIYQYIMAIASVCPSAYPSVCLSILLSICPSGMNCDSTKRDVAFA